SLSLFFASIALYRTLYFFPTRRSSDLGFGNVHFKSSVNRAPRQATPGTPGERRELKLELRVLADVGLLGMPNAGKSTFIRAVSRSEEHTSELQSRENLVCRLLLENKKR